MTYLGFIFKQYLSWSKLQLMLTISISYLLKPISKEEKLSRLDFNIIIENHPTYSGEAKTKLHKFINKELGKDSYSLF